MFVVQASSPHAIHTGYFSEMVKRIGRAIEFPGRSLLQFAQLLP